MHLDCPVCESTITRPDFDFDTMRCCEACGADWVTETGEVLLDPRLVED